MFGKNKKNAGKNSSSHSSREQKNMECGSESRNSDSASSNNRNAKNCK